MKTFLTLIQILAIILVCFWTYLYIQTPPSINTILFAMAMLVTGIILGIALVANNLKSQHGKINALKREEEKKSISSTENQAKVKVLEAKIKTLEKALETALKNK